MFCQEKKTAWILFEPFEQHTIQCHVEKTNVTNAIPSLCVPVRQQVFYTAETERPASQGHQQQRPCTEPTQPPVFKRKHAAFKCFDKEIKLLPTLKPFMTECLSNISFRFSLLRLTYTLCHWSCSLSTGGDRRSAIKDSLANELVKQEWSQNRSQNEYIILREISGANNINRHV